MHASRFHDACRVEMVGVFDEVCLHSSKGFIFFAVGVVLDEVCLGSKGFIGLAVDV